jgi:Holliday junction resolvasome RuvABC endonuclease subunit
MNKISIAGMDPSMSNFGVVRALIDLDTLFVEVTSMEVVQTTPEADKAKRKVVRKNSEDLDRACLLHAGAVKHASEVQLVFAEVPVGSQSSRAMASYGMSLGVLAAVSALVPIIQVTPTEVKVAATGIKTATKGEMIEAMMTKYPNAPWPTRMSKGVRVPIAGECEHLADALAAIEAGMKTEEFRTTLAMMRRYFAVPA